MSILETDNGAAETDGFEAQQTTVGTAENHQSVVVTDPTTSGMIFL